MFGFDGVHALCEGEYCVDSLGYFLDYYEADLNLVIEWDENHHKYNKIKDSIRENKIKDVMNCIFIRMDDNKYDLTDKNSYYFIFRDVVRDIVIKQINKNKMDM